MLDISKLKKRSVKSSMITFVTNKPVPNEPAVNTLAPFKGVDGKNYLIGYDKKLYEVTNCYAFAMGWQLPAYNKYDDYVPGFLSGKVYSEVLAEKLVREDLERVGRTVYEVVYDIPKELPDGEGYWIKFLQCPKKGDLGAHFMRKDKKSGRWVHKMGWSLPPKIVVRNLEVCDKIDFVMRQYNLVGLAREDVLNMVKPYLSKEVYTGKMLVRSEVETDDSADYVSFTEADSLETYKAMWAMRVSEPKM